jgi:monovalent cation:H+ antiporter-2, CPA2 family
MPIDAAFLEVLLLLGLTVAVVLIFQRLRMPSSLAYLLVGLVLGPHTMGPVVDARPMQPMADLGVVFLLFTIGLSFSLPQIRSLRDQVLGLGTAQVALTTTVVGVLGWILGLPPAAAFVVGAVFAQSSTTILSKQLAEQNEDRARHARLGIAMSVFQDVTAVPFVVVIPVLGSGDVHAMGIALIWALGKAALAFALVLGAGRAVLSLLFRVVARRRSAELFTLTVLFTALFSGALTQVLGLSMAFGAFLAGMVLGETEFRHQVDSTIRPFRDVLLGLFFIGIGMLVDPAALASVWHWGLLGAAVLLVVKTLLVTLVVARTGEDTGNAWRTGLLLAVGGEFGFALLALGMQSDIVEPRLGQIVLTSVLLSMIAGPALIRHNHAIARALSPPRRRADSIEPLPPAAASGPLEGHVLLIGYGRIGQGIARLLESEHILYAAIDPDINRVREARHAGERVHYGDGSELELLEALQASRAKLVIIAHEDTPSALRTLEQLRAHHPELPVMVRSRDQSGVETLRSAGASEVFPETLELGLMIAAQALLHLDVPPGRVQERVRSERACHYLHLRELYTGDHLHKSSSELADDRQLRPLTVAPGSAWVGRSLAQLRLEGGVVTAVVRDGLRTADPAPERVLAAGDTVVLFGSPEVLHQASRELEHAG